MIKIEDLFTKLRNDLIDAEGQIEFTFNGIKRTVLSTDIIGNIMQDWLPSWFEENDIEYTTLKNTQEFPDYTININGEKLLLEVKAWNALKAPAFDLANFESYIETIEEDPLKLDAYYLIMGYIPDNGNIKINDIYLKKIWEVTGKGTDIPLRVQKKRDIIYNIRPVNFPKEFAQPFNDKLDFLNAIKDTMVSYDSSKKDMDAWIKHVVKEYNKNTHSTPIELNS